MTTQQDFERLSAYLDHQLPSAEQAALEARLAREPALRQTLAEMRYTVSALKALPLVKPPRSFTLKPHQVEQAASIWSRLFPVFRLATALTAFALVLTVMGEWAGSSSRPLASAPMLQPAVAVQEAAPTSAVALTQAASKMAESTTAPAAGGAAIGPPAGTEPEATTLPGTADSTMMRAADAPTETPMAAAFSSEMLPGEIVTTAMDVASGVPEVTATLEATPLAVANVAPADPDATQATPIAVPEPPSLWRYPQIGLAILTVLLTIATWLTRRK